MTEKTIKDYLEAKTGVPAVLEIPSPMPERFLLLERTGGGERGRLCTPTFAVQSYGPTMLSAAELNDRVKTAMRDMVELPQICRVELNSDYNFTDPESKKYRYQAVFHVTHYKEGT